MLLSGHVHCVKGQWEVGESAGGSRNDLEKFATNPQYLLTLTETGVWHIHPIIASRVYLVTQIEPKKVYYMSMCVGRGGEVVRTLDSQSRESRYESFCGRFETNNFIYPTLPQFTQL